MVEFLRNFVPGRLRPGKPGYLPEAAGQGNLRFGRGVPSKSLAPKFRIPLDIVGGRTLSYHPGGF